MDLDGLLAHYFGSDDLEALDEAAIARGHEALSIDFGVERDPGRRFALWSLMHMLGEAPDPDAAFKGRADREAAWNLIRLTGRVERG
ncbi:hypothetical protein [Sphingobium boeckii]|uniref:Uncharacterized protein n=1 Tax=Sphingobium boeckii TaxID=1082345 RepID=A0A7W9AHF4_9SPHN|nr:hypothetical protein [Sphingobium boeckii]MBB5685471.1 hypothetical protein [Sphingobium boeckii]